MVSSAFCPTHDDDPAGDLAFTVEFRDAAAHSGPILDPRDIPNRTTIPSAVVRSGMDLKSSSDAR